MLIFPPVTLSLLFLVSCGIFENLVACVYVCMSVCGDVLLKIKMDGLPIFYFFTNTTYTSNRKMENLKKSSFHRVFDKCKF